MKITIFALLTSVLIFNNCHPADLKRESDIKRAFEFLERLVPKNDINELYKAIKIATADPERERAAREKAWQEHHAQATAKLIQMARTEFLVKKQ
jgi:hypothetical protein